MIIIKNLYYVKCIYFIYTSLSLNSITLFITWQFPSLMKIFIIILFLILFSVLILILLNIIDIIFIYKYNKKILFKEKIKYIFINTLLLLCFGIISIILEFYLMEFNINILPNLSLTYPLLLISLLISVIIINIIKSNNIFKYIKSWFLSFLFFFILRKTLLLLAFFIGFFINQEFGNLLWTWLTNNIFKVIFFEIYISGYFRDLYSEGSFLHSLFKPRDRELSTIILGEDIFYLFSHAFGISIETWNKDHPDNFNNIIDKLTDVLHVELDHTQASLLAYFNQSSQFKINPWGWVCMGYSAKNNGKTVYIVPYQYVDFTMDKCEKVGVYVFSGQNKDRKALLDAHNISESELKDSGKYMLFFTKRLKDGKIEAWYNLYQKVHTQEYYTLPEFLENNTLFVEHGGRGYYLYYPNKMAYTGKNLYVKDLKTGQFIKTNLITPPTYSLDDEHKGPDGVQELSSSEGIIEHPLVRIRWINVKKD